MSQFTAASQRLVVHIVHGDVEQRSGGEGCLSTVPLMSLSPFVAGKKSKKQKGKTVPLTDFLNDGKPALDGFAIKHTNWADEMEKEDGECPMPRCPGAGSHAALVDRLLRPGREEGSQHRLAHGAEGGALGHHRHYSGAGRPAVQSAHLEYTVRYDRGRDQRIVPQFAGANLPLLLLCIFYM